MGTNGIWIQPLFVYVTIRIHYVDGYESAIHRLEKSFIKKKNCMI